MIRPISYKPRAEASRKESLFVRSVEVIMGNTKSAKLLQKTCRILSPPLLQYILYKAIEIRDLTCIEYLVRYWPFEKMSFDVYEFFDIDMDEIAFFWNKGWMRGGTKDWRTRRGTRDWMKDEDAINGVRYARKHHSLFCNFGHVTLHFGEEMVDTIANAIYTRVFVDQPVDQASSENKQFMVDLSMVQLGDPEEPSKA